MPQRHSKNAGDKHHFTYQERAELGYGTQKVRYGADSQLPFGNCCLCLQAAKDPMATPSGHVYCRECIIEYLLAKTQDLKRHRAAYEAQQAAAVQQQQADAATKQITEVAKFVQGQAKLGPGATRPAANPVGGGGGAPVIHGNTGNKPAAASASSSSALVTFADSALVVAEQSSSAGGSSSSSGSTLGKRGRAAVTPAELEAAAKAEAQQAMAKMAKVVDDTPLEQHKEILKRTSFWLPTFTPEHLDETIAPPESRPRSPMSGEPLRTKDLVAVHFTLDSEKHSKGSGSAGRIICAVTRREISCQPAVLLAKSGQVMLKSAADEFAVPTMTCPVTGEKFKKKDVIELVRPGSSFAAQRPGRV